MEVVEAATYLTVWTVPLTLRASAIATAPASPIWLFPRLQEQLSKHNLKYHFSRALAVRENHRIHGNVLKSVQHGIGLKEISKRNDTMVADFATPQIHLCQSCKR